MKKLLCALAVASVGLFGQAHANSALRETCRDHAVLGNGMCDNYMLGVVHGLLIAEHIWGHGETCVPANVDGEQARAMLNSFMAAHPETLNQPDAIIASRAILQGFNCPGIPTH